MKKLFIAEKPSVAREFASALKMPANSRDGFIENEEYIVTWCFGHLVTMSYPDKYDEKYKRWSVETLPFIPDQYLYEIIPSAAKQFKLVSKLLSRDDVDTIYVCTDSGREGEYIYRLVEQMSPECVRSKTRKRVWIDSQTEEEILKGIKNAKNLSEYDDLASSAYLRAKEDYLMGINFSRLLTLKYGRFINTFTDDKWTSVSVGRVMTCVLGMVVKREIEIRNFVKTPFYRIAAGFNGNGCSYEGSWKVYDKSAYRDHPCLYKDCGFTEKEHALSLIENLKKTDPFKGTVASVSRKTEKKNAPLLYNLAELQNECSKRLHISPDETLKIVQELYEKKLVTYPRTDARVLSSAVAKEIDKNIKGLTNYQPAAAFASHVLDSGAYRSIGNSRYTNDKLITDHYAIIPTGQGLNGLKRMNEANVTVYDMITSRFLAVFFGPAVYLKTSVETYIGNELFVTSAKSIKDEGYAVVEKSMTASVDTNDKDPENDAVSSCEGIENLKKGMTVDITFLETREGSTTPPKRYTSGSMILAMENAGNLIEDEELREQIKGSGIGTSATRAEILNKLVKNKYIKLNKKTQVLTPEFLGEMIYYTVGLSVRSLLMPKLTASWEKGLASVADGAVSEKEYMEKLEAFIIKNINDVKALNNTKQLEKYFNYSRQFYVKRSGKGISNGGTNKKPRAVRS